MDTNITPRSSIASTSNVTPRDMNTTTKPDRLLSHPTVKTRLEKKMPLMALAMVPAFIARRAASKNGSRSAVAHSLPAEVWLEILNTASLDTLMAIARTCKKIYKCAGGMPKAIAEVRHDIEFIAEHDLYNIQRQYQRGELNEWQAKAAIRDICNEQQYVKARTNWNAALVLNELAKCVEVRSVKIVGEKIENRFGGIHEEPAHANVVHFTGLVKQLGKLAISGKLIKTELTLSPDSLKSLHQLFKRLSRHPEIRAFISLKWGNIAALPWSDYKRILKSLNANPYITELHVRDIDPVHADRLIDTVNTMPRLRLLKMENCKLPSSEAFSDTLANNTTVQTLRIQGGRLEGAGSFNADLLLGNRSIEKLILESLTHEETKKFIEILPTMFNLAKLSFEFPIEDKDVLAFVKSVKAGNNEALKKVKFGSGGIGYSGKKALYDIRESMQIDGVTPASSAAQAKEAAKKAARAVKKTAAVIAIIPLIPILLIANATGIINLESS